MMNGISWAAPRRMADGESVRVCVGVPLAASRLGPELRVCGSDSANYGPPIAPDLGKRETVVGSARTNAAEFVVSWGNAQQAHSGGRLELSHSAGFHSTGVAPTRAKVMWGSSD